jgi:uncharacterized protein YjiS (DUF1127 family)
MAGAGPTRIPKLHRSIRTSGPFRTKCTRERAVARVILDREKKTASAAGPNGASFPVRHDGKNESPVSLRISPWRICIARAAAPIARWCHRAFEASLRRHILRVTRNSQLRELAELDDRQLKDIGISRDEARTGRRALERE